MTEPLQLLLVIDSFGAGGAQNQLSLLAAGLAERGHKVHTYQYHLDDTFGNRLSAARITRHIASNTPPWQRVLRLKKLLNKISFDVAIAYMDKPGLILALASLGSDTPIVISHRWTTQWRELSRIEQQLRLWTNRCAHAIVCNSHHERHFWQSKLPNAQIDTIWNGMPVPGEDKRPIDHRPLPDVIDSDTRVFLVVGTICRHKSLHLIIDALYELRQKDLSLPLICCVGEPKSSEPDDQLYEQELKDALRTHGLSKNWIWLGHRNNPLPLYKNAFALIHASIVEGLPNVVCEAQMSGLPVIASNTLDHPAMVQEGISGCLFNPASHPTLAEALEKMLQVNPLKYDQMCEAAKLHARSAYGLEGFINKYEMLFYKLSGRHTEPQHPKT